jgi:hypothetical protein
MKAAFVYQTAHSRREYLGNSNGGFEDVKGRAGLLLQGLRQRQYSGWSGSGDTSLQLSLST